MLRRAQGRWLEDRASLRRKDQPVVEKQRVLRDSVGKIMNLTDGSNSRNEASATKHFKAVPAFKISTPASTENSCKQNLTFIQRQKIAHAAPSPSSAIKVSPGVAHLSSLIGFHNAVKRPVKIRDLLL
ncbi:uncharacterized protein [Typha latifolia]|uniref:uncharacterized protein n=1 Tax=Typha latifolia TaxID=4733 RepID=UPI003C304E80